MPPLCGVIPSAARSLSGAPIQEQERFLAALAMTNEHFSMLLTPDKSLRLSIEVIFILLGGLVMWLGATHHIFFDRRRIGWLLLSIALIVWGARALYQPGKYWSRSENITRGLSLLLLGVVMLAISRVPFSWVGPLLSAAGLLLLLRGLAGSMLVFRRN
jgi:hypothetical protein